MTGQQTHSERESVAVTGRSSRTVSVAAVTGAFAGPAAALAYESGNLHVVSAGSLMDVWLVAAAAAVGAGLGVFAFTRGARLAGIVAFVPNALVMALYGFLASFFSLGGSR